MDFIQDIDDSGVRERLFAPLLEVARERCRSIRKCSGLSDEDFLLAGCLRVVSGASSGREHVQNASEAYGIGLDVSGFFKALRSPRRRAMVEECSRELATLCARRLAGIDALEEFAELDGLQVVAVDGHHIEEASHSARGGRERTVNTLYELDVRNGVAQPLAVAASAQGASSEIKALRGSERRRSASSLDLVDRGYVDIRWWGAQAEKGSLMVTRAKSNMAPFFRRELEWDRSAALNRGVLADREAGFNCGGTLRWIEFEDPESGERFAFVSTCWSLPPGLLCMLYLMRWRIEKLYDSFKNKLGQTKAWATTEHARSMQAHFICMAHNLLVLFAAQLERDHGIREEKIGRKRERWLAARASKAARDGRSLHVFHSLIRRASQISLQFLRSLRNALLARMPFEQALPLFRRSMLDYYH